MIDSIGGSKGGGVGAPGTRPPWGSKFFHFPAVFGKNLKNNSNFGSWRTPLGKILDPPLDRSTCETLLHNVICDFTNFAGGGDYE